MMIKKVETYLKKHHMIEKQDVVVAGISGGADSVCLLCQLVEYRKQLPFTLVVVHVNHGIRKEAYKDAEYVESLCQKYELPFHLIEEDVKALAEKDGLSEEEAGRNVRYRAFHQIMEDYGGKGKIAVAHNQNDNAETLLFHLFRGSGVAGMCGILPVRDNIIRPLLCLTRQEIEEYLRKEKISWCIDFTNEENTYSRNKIRNRILPMVEEEICADASKHIAGTAETMAQLQDFLQTLITEKFNMVVDCKKDKRVIEKKEFTALPEYLQSEIILKIFAQLTPYRKDMGAVHVKSVMELIKKQGEKRIDLPYGLVARNEYEKLVIEKYSTSEAEDICISLKPGKEYILPDGKKLICREFKYENFGNIPEKSYTKWFDYDKITTCPVLRFRRTGDYLTINEKCQKKSLKEYFITEKVPRHQREKMLLIADENHILWVLGMRISEAYKVTHETKRILEIEVQPERERSHLNG